MIYCPKCGTENEDKDKFCKNCGNDLNLASENSDSKQGKTENRFFDKNLKILIGVTVSFVVLCAVIAVVNSIPVSDQEFQAKHVQWSNDIHASMTDTTNVYNLYMDGKMSKEDADNKLQEQKDKVKNITDDIRKTNVPVKYASVSNGDSGAVSNLNEAIEYYDLVVKYGTVSAIGQANLRFEVAQRCIDRADTEFNNL